MTRTISALDLTADPVALTAAMVDVASVSGEERQLADLLEHALREQAPHLEVLRSGDAVLARTRLGRAHRVLLAGHIDTVPIADNVPSRRADGIVHGCGTSDMKSGDAVFAHLAATLPEPRHDVTFVFYDCEEIEAERNGLGRIEREHREWLDADLAILGEPTDGALEAGCQGTLRVELRTAGRRAHSARSWLGDNAIHRAGEILSRLASYEARDVDIDGCRYREGLQAVRISGGVAGNVVPDECIVTVNFRFAPDRSTEQAVQHVREVFDGIPLVVTDLSAGALPGLSAPAAAEFVEASGAVPRAKYGWTDVSRFAALGIPAVNYGPGDPNLAHTRDEHVAEDAITACTAVLRRYLGS
ncbi:succinyldiaminopimelate desuccinylase [Pseudonocardia autotrophica]|uniref:Succinyl-diaminopimelate desuccinylase n=2 Tax=Pseudonocardia TaxID=1847 RepID=A0A1Y2N4M1_PSEAH|nr:Succinyl-diaminopimelate desuccinylase [Pseudonocardia autotrophica]TDN75950.1 succinyldiaminopimelate desuccinylase [Pseudonocardia autotrophica]BBF99922.1 succinyl-diaminopimelate desuccinylase [Pseudonocardia autotrophica]GEC24981.1 succinyl-diaminopimelate desuccinylase [Pseudonocardia saturnea]